MINVTITRKGIQLIKVVNFNYLGYGEPLMGFWPYFLQAQESDGGGAFSPFSRDPSTSLMGTDTTLFCMPLLLCALIKPTN